MTNSDNLNDTSNPNRDSGYYAVDARRVIQVFEMFQMRPSHFAASGKAGAQGVYYDAKKIIEGRTGNKWGHHTPRAIESFCHFTQSENGTLLPWRELIEHRDFYDGKEGAGRRTGNLLLTEKRVQLNHQAMTTTRQQNELSLEQLANKTALPIRLIEAMENGHWVTMTDTTASLIAEALDVSKQTLFAKIPIESKIDAGHTTDAGSANNADKASASDPAAGKQRMKKVSLLAVALGIVLWAGYQFYPSKQTDDILLTDLSQQDINKLTGCWNWSTGSYIKIDQDGTAHNGPFGASWKVTDLSKRQYNITWPSFVDTLTLSTEGDALSGTNNYGISITATRKSGDKANIVGHWLWMNGVTVDIRSDFTIAGGPLKGTWHKAGRNWVLEWPLVDTVMLSKNGLNLRTKNQFGSATANRDTSCNDN